MPFLILIILHLCSIVSKSLYRLTKFPLNRLAKQITEIYEPTDNPTYTKAYEKRVYGGCQFFAFQTDNT